MHFICYEAKENENIGYNNALHQAKPIEAVAASTSVPAEQTEALITTSVQSL